MTKSNLKFFKNSKSLPVDTFFRNVLYDKKIGYYNTKIPFGDKGDFITAPKISNLFSEIISIWFILTWQKLGRPKNFNIVELGPGDGELVKTLIRVSKKFPDFNAAKKIFLYEGKFDIVANFAAHKHVRSEKDIFSIEALIKNNIFGAIDLLNLLTKYPPKFFFSVSTDKATNPVNIMGASKSLMEKIIISFKNHFKVSTARFANVAFSNGSLLYGFINRIKKNQPLSCPTDIKRYFVTPKESGQICLLSTFLGESGDVFFPKFDFKNKIFFKSILLEFLNYMGFKPKIFDNELDAKRFKNSNNENIYSVYFFKSNTSGEKKYEEFYAKNEVVNLDKYESLGYVKPKIIKLNIDKLKDDFDTIFSKKNLNKKMIIDLLENHIPSFNHFDTGINLDQKM